MTDENRDSAGLAAAIGAHGSQDNGSG